MSAPEADDDATARSRCAALAALLGAHRAVGAWGVMSSALAASGLLAAAFGLVPPMADAAALFLVAAGLLGLAERYLAFRLRLDEALFHALATGRLAGLPALDDGLAWLGLRPATSTSMSTTAPRSLHERLRGTRALLRRHLATVLLQTLFLTAALAAGFLLHPPA
ncbi:hypothetical protein NS331_02215 [Pseudacidovorax intermedius]|uniref:Uncharacterized protein n=1 Tax=Pseudacidovorax intermedius TaxID=433924 RepID=A0A147HBK8_9BURK|nr:hypothetical protein NS331_02215 [Pseudacidovorax intermedius]